jgi:ABC-type uncharacterized transport system ATPase subunit
MEEVLRMSDRTLVMCQGRITGELQRDALSEEVGDAPGDRSGMTNVQ